MKSLTFGKIKIIYCYLMCLFCVMFTLIRVSIITENALKLVFFDTFYNIPYNFEKDLFSALPDNRKLPTAEIEKLRQDTIAHNKAFQNKKLQKDIMLELPALFYALITLIIHGFLIRSTKKSSEDE